MRLRRTVDYPADALSSRFASEPAGSSVRDRDFTGRSEDQKLWWFAAPAARNREMGRAGGSANPNRSPSVPLIFL